MNNNDNRFLSVFTLAAITCVGALSAATTTFTDDVIVGEQGNAAALVVKGYNDGSLMFRVANHSDLSNILTVNRYGVGVLGLNDGSQMFGVINSSTNLNLLSVRNSGVGIGISSPSSILDVAAATRSGTHSGGLTAYITGDISPVQGIRFAHSNGTQGIDFGYEGIQKYTNGTNNWQKHLTIDSSEGGALILQNRTTGNVGIGTSAPTSKLEVVGAVKVAGTAAMGTGVSPRPTDQVVVGKYNDKRTADTATTPPTDHTTGVFIVGSGQGSGQSTPERNSIRVLDDGTVLVQKSGDISMGNFTQGPKP